MIREVEFTAWWDEKRTLETMWEQLYAARTLFDFEAADIIYFRDPYRKKPFSKEVFLKRIQTLATPLPNSILFNTQFPSTQGHSLTLVDDWCQEVKTRIDAVSVWAIEHGAVQTFVVDTAFNTQQSTQFISNSKGCGFYDPDSAHTTKTIHTDKYEVDISRNPGRKIRREHYFEVIGSHMWFSDAFWPLVGKTVHDFVPPKDVQTYRIGDCMTKIVAAESPFMDTPRAEVMNDLRKAIYGVDTLPPWPYPLPEEARGPEYTGERPKGPKPGWDHWVGAGRPRRTIDGDTSS
jgi:hypothetical protein